MSISTPDTLSFPFSFVHMQNHEEYQPYFHKYLELYENLKNLMHQ